MHDLKTDSEVFQAVISGLKSFEIRFNDRDFKVGDRLHLLETVSTGEEMAAGAVLEYTGGSCIVVVNHILHGPIYGLSDGWVIMSIEHEAGDFYPEPDLQAWALKLKEVVEGMGHGHACDARYCQVCGRTDYAGCGTITKHERRTGKRTCGKSEALRLLREVLRAVDEWDLNWADGLDANVERIKDIVRAALGGEKSTAPAFTLPPETPPPE